MTDSYTNLTKSYNSHYEIIEKSFDDYKTYRIGHKYRSEVEWNLSGIKALHYSKLLIIYINDEWDNTFTRDSSTLYIKYCVINDIQDFNAQTESLCEHTWKNIIKQYIKSAQCGYSGDGCDDMVELNEYYLNQLEIFINKFDENLSKYKTKYDEHKSHFISKYIMLGHLNQLYPIYTLINRDYYNIYSFDTTRITFLKTIKHSCIGFIESIELALSPFNKIKYNKTEREHMKKIITIFEKTQSLLGTSNSNFIGCILTRLFCKDIALAISDYI